MNSTTGETSPHRELASVSLQDSTLDLISMSSLKKRELPSKGAVESMYGHYNSKPMTSLNSLIASHRSTLKSVHSQFVLDSMKSTRDKAVSFDYGYGETTTPERPTKRRRFQRRNSKTPAMLMAMSSRNLNYDLLKTDEELLTPPPAKKITTASLFNDDDDDDDDNWDGGLEIAQELVKQLQQRRNSSAASRSMSPAPAAA